jgi:hypothetical protein
MIKDLGYLIVKCPVRVESQNNGYEALFFENRRAGEVIRVLEKVKDVKDYYGGITQDEAINNIAKKYAKPLFESLKGK